MIPRILNLQGMLGIAASLLLLVMLLVKAGDARHWRKQSGRYEQLHAAGQAALAQTSPIIAPPLKPRAPPTKPMRIASPLNNAQFPKGPIMTSKPAWPMLALALTACSSARHRPQPISAVAEQRLCPPPAQPPARLVVPPRKTDFLSQTA